jgi:hypothetical protein
MCQVGIALKPSTPAELVLPYLQQGLLDMVRVGDAARQAGTFRCIALQHAGTFRRIAFATCMLYSVDRRQHIASAFHTSAVQRTRIGTAEVAAL